MLYKELYLFIFILSMPLIALEDTSTATVSAAKKPSHTHRIISLAPHITELAFSAGIGNLLVGVSSYSDFPEEAKRIAVTSSYKKINYEAIVALKATLALAWHKGNNEQSLKRLEDLGIEVLRIELITLDDIAKQIRILSKLGNHSTLGEKNAKQTSNTLNALRKKYQNQSPVDMYYQIWHQPQMTVNGNHYISQIMQLCGAHNIFSEAIPLVPKVSIESIVKRRPQIIVTADKNNRIKDLKLWQQWPQLPAVKNKQLYAVHPDLISRPSARIVQGAQKLCEQVNIARSIN